MPGYYDNENGCYVEAPWLDEGDWYVDEEGMLYIIPQAGAVAEIEGPDNDMIDQLNAMCRESDPDLPDIDEVEGLGLTYVPDHLHRLDPDRGYYHA